MKFGISTYSLHQAVSAGKMTLLDVIQWIADHGGEHVEIVPIQTNLIENSELVDQIVAKAASCGIEISNYAIGANFITETEEEYRAAIDLVKQHVDVAAKLGVKRMRHDVASRPDTSIKNFNADLPKLAKACQEIADYAAQFDIITSVENHGYYIQASDRVQALIHATDRENFRTTLDVGNFLCVDEDPIIAIQNNIEYASMVHIKDFYVRTPDKNPGEGWFKSAGGNYLRGAIAGQGDIDLYKAISIIKQSNYDGYISLEFEGMEECTKGARIAFDNIKRIWDEV